jgi:3' exoribonuclease, RNase T-like
VDLFLNTEYIDHDRRLELISLGVVAADGREFYAISAEFDPTDADDFVRMTVLPKLEPVGHTAWMSREEMRVSLLEFIGDIVPTFWSYGSAPWDWLALAQLFPLEERVPDGWQYSAYDVSCLVELAGIRLGDPRLPQPPPNQHHALVDARWARDVHRAVQGLSSEHSRNDVGVTDLVVDTEFIEREQEIELISLAVVCADGREFYAVSTEFDGTRANEFVRTTVLPLLEPRNSQVWMSREKIRYALLDFVGETVPRFWTWGGAPYDWMVIAQLFPVADRMPEGWLYTAYDIMLLVERAGLTIDPLDPVLPPPPSDAHHALADARWASEVLRTIRR